MWYLILLNALFASTFTIGKAILEYVQPIFFVSIRLMISGLLLISYQYFIKKESLRFKKEHFWLFFQLAFFLFYCSYVLDFAVLKYIDSIKWSQLYTLTPFFVGIFSYFVLDERITLKKGFGFLLGLVGIVPIILVKTGQEGILGSFLIFSVSEIIMLISVVLYAYGWVIARKLIKLGYSPIQVNGLPMLSSGILCLLTSPFIDTWYPSPIMHIQGFIGLLGFLIAITIFAYLVNMYLLRLYTATFLRFLGFINPLYVALYSWFFLRETVTWHFFVSVILVFLGLYMFYQEELRENSV